MDNDVPESMGQVNENEIKSKLKYQEPYAISIFHY